MENKKQPVKKAGGVKIIIPIVLILLLALGGGVFAALRARQPQQTETPQPEQVQDSAQQLQEQLADSGTETIEINEEITVTTPLTVSGNKTLTGSGRVTFRASEAPELSLKGCQIPEDECQMLRQPELDGAPALLTVSDGGSLRLGGNVTLDGGGYGLAVKVGSGGSLTVEDEAAVTGGAGANILSDGSVSVAGGSVTAKDGLNIISRGRLSISGGSVESDAQRLPSVLAEGTVELSGGRLLSDGGTNLYLTGGELNVTGGELTGGAMDNIFAASGSVNITGGSLLDAEHGLHNLGAASVTGGTWNNNTNQIYNQGEAQVRDLSFQIAVGHGLVNTGEQAHMSLKDVTIESSVVHGVYNVRGAHMEAEGLTVQSAMAKGVHNGGGFFTGKDITVVRALGAGVGNDIEKGYAGEGEVSIENLTVLKANNYNLLCTTGKMSIKNAELGVIQSNSVQVTGGELTLENVQIKGTAGSGAFHGVYLLGGTVNATNVDIGSVVSRGIQNRGGHFIGRDITVTGAKGTSVGNQISVDGVTNGTIDITGLVVKSSTGYSIQNSDGGTVNITDAQVYVTDTTAVRIDKGIIRLTNVQIIGTTSRGQAANQYNGITAMGGQVVLNNVRFHNMLGRAISNDGASVSGSGVSVDTTGGGGIVNVSGTTILSAVNTRKTLGYSLDVTGGSMTIYNAVLDSSTQSTDARVKEGTMSLNHVTFNGAPTFTDDKGVVNKYNCITANSGQLLLDDVTFNDPAGRGLNNQGATVTGQNVKVNRAGGTSIYNTKGSVELDGVTVRDGGGYFVDAASGSVSLRNADLGVGTTTVVNVGAGSVVELRDTVLQGCAAGNAVYVRQDAAFSFENLTIRNAGARALSNGNNGSNVLGGAVSGKGLILENATGTALANDSGTMEIQDVSITGGKAYLIDNRSEMSLSGVTLRKAPIRAVNNNATGRMTLRDYDLQELSAQGVYNNGGTLILGDGLIDAPSGDALASGSGEIRLEGMVELRSGSNPVNLGGRLSLTPEAGLLTDGGTVRMARGSLIALTGESFRNTAEQTVRLEPEVYEPGTVLVTTSSQAAVQAAEAVFQSFSVFRFKLQVSGTDLVTAPGEDQPIGEAKEVQVSDWESLKSAVESAQSGDNLRLILTGPVSQTGEGPATVGVNGEMKIAVTDNGAGYTLTRTDLNGALFTVSTGAELSLEGSLTLDGASSSDAKAAQPLLLNRGSLTVDSGVTLQNAFRDGANNSLNGSGKSGGAIESNGTLILKGTVTASGSGNGTAVSVLGGSAQLDGVKLNGNMGRAIRIGGGTAEIKNSEFNNNTPPSGGGAGVLIDGASVTLTDCKLNGNQSTDTGGGLQTTDKASVVTMTGCEVKDNTAAKNGGGIQLAGGGAQLTMSGCTVSGNKGASGGGVNVNAAGDSLTMTGCTVSGNTASGSSGAVHVANAGTVLLKDTSLTDNKTTGSGSYGGAINISNASASVTLDGCAVTGNASANGGGINVSGGCAVTLTGETVLKDNSTTGLGSQIRCGNAACVIKLGSQVKISGGGEAAMFGLGGNGMRLTLTGPMDPANQLTVGGSGLKEGGVILYGYDAENQDAPINGWIAAAAKQITVLGYELTVDETGKLSSGSAQEVETVEVSDWDSLKNALEGAQEGQALKAVLTGPLTQSGGTVTLDQGASLTVTDEGKGYTIQRGDKAAALFNVKAGSLSLEGSLTLDGASSSSDKATQPLLLNDSNGTLRIAGGVTLKNAYRDGANNSLTGSGKSGGAIESRGELVLNGSVTASGSGNGTAVSVLGGMLTMDGAKLNGNAGRAIRIGGGTAEIKNCEFNNNSGASGGGGVLIDAANVTMTGCTVSGNNSSGSGGGLQTTDKTSILTMTGCTVENNTSATSSGALHPADAGTIRLVNSRFAGNVSKKDYGGVINVAKSNSQITLDGCTVTGNSAVNGGAINVSGGCSVTLTGNTVLSDNTASGVGSQIRMGNTNSVLNLGSQVKISGGGEGAMIGLGMGGMQLKLTGPMDTSNHITIGGSGLAAGNVILAGYDSADPGAAINGWIAAAAKQITVLGYDLIVDETGKLAAPAAPAPGEDPGAGGQAVPAAQAEEPPLPQEGEAPSDEAVPVP